jgi:hypothetical protein
MIYLSALGSSTSIGIEHTWSFVSAQPIHIYCEVVMYVMKYC